MPNPQKAQEIAKEILARGFPIKASPVKDTQIDQDHSFWVGIPQSQLSINKAAPIEQALRLDSVVNVLSKEALAGFQGGAYYKFMDKAGNVVFAMMGDVYGVNGTAIPGAPSEVHPNESKFLPFEVVVNVSSIEAVPSRLEGPALDSIKKLVGDLAKGLDGTKNDLIKIGVDIAEIYAAIEAAA